jgi:hypothetical protein
MDLVSIFKQKVAAGDKLTPDRRHFLSIELNRLDLIKAKTAFTLIRSYRIRFDTTRRVGDTESQIPYYGVETSAGIEFSLDAMPEGPETFETF